MKQHTAVRFPPVSGYDIPGLERWLQRMAARGMQFSMTLGPFTLFLPAEPTSLRIHLEPARTKIAEDDPEIIGLYESAGWTHLGDFRKNFYVFATPEPDAQAHTDPQVLSYALRRFFRQKLLGGAGLALLNFLILSFFYSSRFTDPTYLRFYWAELLAGDLLPWLLALQGMGLTDLSYLLGLFSLWKFRRQIRHDLPITTPPASRLAGVLSALAVLPLVLVAAEFTFRYFTHGYFPYDLAGSGFVTMAEIEGPEFRPTGDTMYNMDYISHGDSPLTPENWYYQQWESNRVFGSGGSLADIPHLEINITRYLLPAVAERRAWEGRLSCGGVKTIPSSLDLNDQPVGQADHGDGAVGDPSLVHTDLVRAVRGLHPDPARLGGDGVGPSLELHCKGERGGETVQIDLPDQDTVLIDTGHVPAPGPAAQQEDGADGQQGGGGQHAYPESRAFHSWITVTSRS